MAFIPDDKIQEIRDRIRLEDLVRDYNVFLQPAGGRRLRALCPFHSEKTPSFYVNLEDQYFICFGCKAGGDIFTFLKRIENVDFPDAAEMLARRAGVLLDSDRPGGRTQGRADSSFARRKSALFEALGLAQKYYHQLLLQDPRAEAARAYLLKRGLRRETWERFGLGYSLPEWDAFLRFAVKNGISHEVLEQAGLVRPRASQVEAAGVYDYFRGRVMFPIADGQKRIQGFGARTLGDEHPKYLNTPTTPLFEKGQVLYGLPQARGAIEREKRLAIVEGYTDVLAAHQEGLEFFVATLGTAFTAENARRLRRLAPRVDLVFDGDFAGQSAAERSLSLLVGEDLDVRIYGLQGGKDPCDVLLEIGGERFRRQMEAEALGIFEFKWRRALGHTQGATPAAKELSPGDLARALDEVLDLLLRVPNVVARQLYVQQFSEKLGIPAASVEMRCRSRRLQGQRPPLSPAAERRPGQQAGGSAASDESGARRPWEPLGAPAGAPSGPPDALVHGRDRERGPLRSPGALAGPSQRLSTGLAAGNGSALRTAAGGSAAHLDIDNPCLEEVILEVMLADPESAASRWGQIPRGHFDRPDLPEDLRAVARAIEGQLRRGSLERQQLLACLDHLEAAPLLARIQGRIDRDRGYAGEEGGSNTAGVKGNSRGARRENLDETWERCLREMERGALRQRLRAVEGQMNEAREAGDAERLLTAEREYRQLLREWAR
jgi:DNA primase